MPLPALPGIEPEPLLLRELFAREPGWRVAPDERREIEVDGRRLLLVPLGSCPPAVALLCEPLSGAGLPGYAARRRIRARLRRLHPRHLAVFTDAAHSVQVWSWDGRDPGGPLAARELSRRPGRPDEEWLRRARSIVRDLEAADRPPPARGGAEHPGRPALAGLLRRVRRLHPRAFAPGGPLSGAAGGRARGGTLPQRVQDAIEGTADPRLVRAFWRSLADLAVLDPACGEGAWLLAAMEAIEPVYAACLERMESWVAEEDRASPRGRGGRRLPDFRLALERAARFPSRRRFAREAIVLRTLFGADPDPEGVAAAELALLLRLHPAGEGGAEPPSAGIACHLREGDLGAGFRSAREAGEALAREGRSAALRDLEEEVETAARAERRIVELRLAGAASAEELRAGWETVRLRRRAVAAELAPLRPSRAAGRPLHAWVEHHGVLTRGGFAAERGRAR